MYDERDLLIRTLIGEADNQGELGQAAVAHVIRNRLNSGRYGKTIPDVLFAPKQFEPWNTRRSELMAIPTDSPSYIRAANVVDAVNSGKMEDPTGGATHFANVGTVQARGNTAGMRWINQGLNNGTAVKIGAHTFMSPDSQPGSRPTKEASAQPMIGMPQIMGGAGPDETGLPPILQQQQAGGLAGLFQDPEKFAALAMIAKGLNPWSELDPQQMLAQAQRQKLAQAQQFYERQKDQRDFGLRKEQFEFTKKDKEADNARADKTAGLTEAAKDLIAQGYTPGTPEYVEAYKKYWQSKTVDKRNVGLNPVWGTKDGKPAIGQLSSTGEFVETKMPEGFQPSKGIEKTDLGDSWAYVDKQTGQTLRVVPKNIEAKEAAEERGKAQGQAQVGLQSALTRTDYSIKLIDDLIAHPGRETGTGASSKFDPRNYFPGTDAYNFGVRSKQVKGRTFLDAFDQLRGAGAITEQEGKAATEAAARLDQAQSDEEYVKALLELQTILRYGRANALKKASGNFGQGSPPPAASTGLSPGTYDWDGSKLVRQ